MTSKVCKHIFTCLALVTLISFSFINNPAQVRRQSGGGFSSIAAAPGHRITTDKRAYKLNEQASISGKHFTPLGPVRVVVEQVTGIGAMRAPIAMWNVYADAAGKFTTSWGVSYPGSAFKVTATDLTAAVDTSNEFIILSGGASLEQCRNGAQGSPVPCTGAAWANGNLNASQAHYVEGGSIPYRLILAGLDVGVSHTVTIEWDTTVSSSTHAIDYLTSFDRTETTADPCSGVAGCSLATVSTFPIPLDPNVAAGHDEIPGSLDDITQVAGQFKYFGGTITAVSGYTMSGSFAGASATKITITFTPDSVDSVLAWGGHISTRADWGNANSAVAINGSPFHMRLDNFDGSPGGQDRAIHSDAVIFPAKVIVVVEMQPHSYYPFSFSSTGLDMATFSLDDNGIESDTYQSAHSFSDILLFGVDNQIKVTEDPTPMNYQLVQITCVSDPVPGIGSGTYSTSLVDRQALINLAEGETVTCTFLNQSPTSAKVPVIGSVTDMNGRALSNIVVTAINLSTGEITAARTNMFGRYRLEDLEAGSDYAIAPKSIRYNFEPGAAILNVTGNEGDLNFRAAPRP